MNNSDKEAHALASEAPQSKAKTSSEDVKSATTQEEKDKETKRRISASMRTSAMPAEASVKPVPPAAHLIKPNKPTAATNTENAAPFYKQPKILNQIEKDEETKRRVSVGMKNSALGASRPLPPSQLIRPPASPKIPVSVPDAQKPKLTQTERDEMTKKRVSASMKPGTPVEAPKAPMPSQLAVPQSPNWKPGVAQSDKKPSPLPPRHDSPRPPSPTLLVKSRENPADRSPPTPVAMPKAKMNTPSRSPGTVLAQAEEKRRNSLPFMPASIGDGDMLGAEIKPRASLHPSLGEHKHLGDKKERISFSPSATAVPTRANSSSPPLIERRHLGDRKFRVSPPAKVPGAVAARNSDTDGSPPVSQRRASTSGVPSSPAEHRNLGDKKNRSSLPPAAMPGAVAARNDEDSGAARHRKMGEKKQRVSLPPSAATVTVAPKPPPTTPPPQPQRKLGEKKSSRVSLTPSASPAGFHQSDDEETGDYSWTRTPDSTTTPNSKQQLRTGIAGPGAFFVSRDPTTEQQNEPTAAATTARIVNEKDSDIVVDPHEEAADEVALTNDVEEGQRSSTFSGSTRSSQQAESPSRSHTGRHSRRHSRKVEEEELAPEEKERCFLLRLPWWCGILIPLLLAAVVIAVVVTLVKGRATSGDATSIPRTQAPTVAPTQQVFHGENVPSFTLKAWRDPNSPQSMARAWLQSDPNLGNYTQYRKWQRFALATLYYSTDGNNWKNKSNWLSYKQHECKWFSNFMNTINFKDGEMSNSTCNANGEYEYLSLSGDLLRGTFPPEVTLLTSLVNIDLENNTVHGQVPTEVGNLQNLTSLILNSNELSSTIPSELSKLTKLYSLMLTHNSFTGTIPTVFARLLSLRDFHITKNKITSTVPTEFGNMVQLRTLRLGDNSFNGTVPTAIGMCKQLEFLNIGGNQMSGSIPPILGQLTNLTFLGLSANKFDSTLPTELGKLTNLGTLDISNAGLVGSIPEQLGELQNLVVLTLASNDLSSTIPSALGKLSNLEGLYLSLNHLSGAMPTEIGLLSHLMYLHLYLDSQLQSTIPSEIGELTALKELLLFQTSLSGPIPSTFANLSNLEKLDISDTSLTGTMPNEVCSLASSKQLSVSADCGEVTCCPN